MAGYMRLMPCIQNFKYFVRGFGVSFVIGDTRQMARATHCKLSLFAYWL